MVLDHVFPDNFDPWKRLLLKKFTLQKADSVVCIPNFNGIASSAILKAYNCTSRNNSKNVLVVRKAVKSIDRYMFPTKSCIDDRRRWFLNVLRKFQMWFFKLAFFLRQFSKFSSSNKFKECDRKMIVTHRIMFSGKFSIQKRWRWVFRLQRETLVHYGTQSFSSRTGIQTKLKRKYFANWNEHLAVV